jgi:hypothetical protein
MAEGISFTIGDASDDKSKGPAPKSATPKRPASAGRPSASQAKTKQDVESALAAMKGLYEAASLGLLLMGRPGTATLLAEQEDQLQTANRSAFESSPKLAATIAGVGQISGVGMFLVTNVTVVAQVLLAFRAEGAAIRASMPQDIAEGE